MLKLNLNNNKDLKSYRNIIFCTSSLSVPFTVSLIAKFKETSTIVIQSKELFDFFVKYYPKHDIIFFEEPKSLINKNFLKIIKNHYHNYLLKKKILFFFNKYLNSNVFTNIRAFSPLSAYMLIVLSKKNKIYHQKLVKLSFKTTKQDLKLKILKIYYKMMFDLDCHVIATKNNENLLPYSNKFFKKIASKNIRYKINSNSIKNFISQNFNIPSNKILFLGFGSYLKEGLIEKKLFKDFMKKWSSTCNYKKLLLKRKNFEEKKYYLEKALAEVPSFIPANLLIYNFKIVIGYNSATLFEAANKSCKVISLLYLLSKNTFTVKYYKNYLDKNLKVNKKIFYPKTYEQFINYFK